MFPTLKKKSFVNLGPLNYNFFRFGNMIPEIEIKVSKSGTITEIGNVYFQFRDDEYCYLFIDLFIYLFLFVYFDFLININLMEKNNYKLTITLYKLN